MLSVDITSNYKQHTSIVFILPYLPSPVSVMPAVVPEMPCDAVDDSNSATVSDSEALRGPRWRSIQLTIRGRDGGEGLLVITAEYGRAMVIVGEYVATDGTTARIEIIRRGAQYVDTTTGQNSEVAEALLPLVVRDAPWDVC
jgi:hypothetical protein